MPIIYFIQKDYIISLQLIDDSFFPKKSFVYERKYQKPIIIIETFVPNEYVADCWYIPKEYCYENLVHDLYDGLGRRKPNGKWNPGLLGDHDQALAQNHSHSSNVPSDEPAFKVEDVAIPTTNINDGNYWDKPDYWIMGSDLQTRITGNIYHIKYDDVDHYFRDYKPSNYS